MNKCTRAQKAPAHIIIHYAFNLVARPVRPIYLCIQQIPRLLGLYLSPSRLPAAAPGLGNRLPITAFCIFHCVVTEAALSCSGLQQCYAELPYHDPGSGVWPKSHLCICKWVETMHLRCCLLCWLGLPIPLGGNQSPLLPTWKPCCSQQGWARLMSRESNLTRLWLK